MVLARDRSPPGYFKRWVYPSTYSPSSTPSRRCSALSARALPVAAAIARRTGARIQLALVHDPIAYIPFVPGEVAIPVFDQDLVQSQRERDAEVLAATVTHLREQGLAADGEVLEGTVVEALEEFSQRHAVDLTIMTTHGRSGPERDVFGSVTESVLHGTRLPVLVVHPAPVPVHPPAGEAEPAPSAS